MVQDGLFTEYQSTQFGSGTTVQATSGTFANAAITAGTLPLAYPTTYTGSPSVGNLSMQTGRTSGLGIGNAATVTFGTAFAAAPTVVISANGSAAVGIYVAGTAAGSFVFNGGGSEIVYGWIAIGSGRL